MKPQIALIIIGLHDSEVKFQAELEKLHWKSNMRENKNNAHTSLK